MDFNVLPVIFDLYHVPEEDRFEYFIKLSEVYSVFVRINAVKPETK